MKKVLSLHNIFQIIILSSLFVAHASKAEDLDQLLNGNDTESPKTAEVIKGNKILKTSKAIKSHQVSKVAKKIFSNSTALFFEKEIFQAESQPVQNWIELIENNDWRNAMIQFSEVSHWKKTTVSASTMAALEAWLEFQDGLKVVGLEKLFTLSNPQTLPEKIKKMWRESVKIGEPALHVAAIGWNSNWASIFSNDVKIQMQLKDPAQRFETKDLVAMLQSLPPKHVLRNQITWKLALEFALRGNHEQAAKTLGFLLKDSGEQAVSKDLINMTAARLLYEKGYYSAAISYYEKVSKESDYWFDAKEESAWSYLKKGEPQNALAVTQTLSFPPMRYFVSPESYFVRGAAQIRVCDYSGAMDTLKGFREAFKQRALDLEEVSHGKGILAQMPKAEQDEWMALLAQKKFSVFASKEKTKSLPRLFWLDEKLTRMSESYVQLKSELETVQNVYAASLAQTGLQKKWDELRLNLEKRVQGEKALWLQRMQQTAGVDAEEIKKMLQKMYIIEAEVLSQLSIAEKVTGRLPNKEMPPQNGGTGSKDKEKLEFSQSNEVWFDDLDNYKVDLKKACSFKR